MRCRLVDLMVASVLVAACGGDRPASEARPDSTTTVPTGVTASVTTTVPTSVTTSVTTAPPSSESTVPADTTSAPSTDPVPTPPIVAPLPPSYDSPVPLPTLDGATAASAADINEAGAIVGEARLPLGDEGCCTVAVWWPDATRPPERLDHLIGLPQPATSSALRINDEGVILVTAFEYGIFLVDPSVGSVVEIVIPFALGTPVLFAGGLNDRGDVVGSVQVAWVDEVEGRHAVMHAFRWEASTGDATDLGALPGRESSWAADINDSGLIVGTSRGVGFTSTTLPADGLPPDVTRSFAWDPSTGEMIELSPPFEEVVAVNDAGTAISATGVWMTLPPVFARPDTPFGRFVDINDIGWILAARDPGGSVVDPTSWSSVELPAASATGGPTSINAGGVVVGTAGFDAVIWSPGTS